MDTYGDLAGGDSTKAFFCLQPQRSTSTSVLAMSASHRLHPFARSRKKSNQSTASSPFMSSRESLEFGELTSQPASSDR